MGLEIKIKDAEMLKIYSRSFARLILESDYVVNKAKIRHADTMRYNELKSNLMNLKDTFSENSRNYFSALKEIDELIESGEYEKIGEVQKDVKSQEELIHANWKNLRRGTYFFVREKDRLKTNQILKDIKINPIKYENWEAFG